MSTVINMNSQSPRLSRISPQVETGEDRRMLPYQPDKRQPSSTDVTELDLKSTPKKHESEPLSCEKHCTTKLAVSIVLGLVVCGIPLAVIASLYGQKLATPTSSGSGSNSNSNNLPTQCSSYMSNSDPTRLVSAFNCASCLCDNSLNFPQNWYRFVGGAGTRLANYPPSIGACSASYPAYYNGTYPTTVGSTTTGTICVNVNGNLCHPSYITTISITLCDDYYVFYLAPTSICAIRYCTVF